MRRFYQAIGLSGRQEFVESSPTKALFDRGCVSFFELLVVRSDSSCSDSIPYAHFPKLENSLLAPVFLSLLI